MRLLATPLRALTAGLVLLAAGCATTPPPLQTSAPAPDQVAALLQQHPLFSAEHPGELFPEDNILALDANMRYFANVQVPSVLNDHSRLSRLLDSMISPTQLGLQYSPGVTLNARDTFYQREGNCLSLSSLFIALAREIGLDAHYNEVSVPPSWELLASNSVALYKHINVVVELDDGEQVVDLSVENYEYHYPQKRISEQAAAAKYYSNRAVEFLNKNDLANAYIYFHRALTINPQEAYIWGNMGTLFRRIEQYQYAETAFRQALSIDDSDHVALANLGRLYADTGRQKQATQIARTIASQQYKNPYWHYSRAREVFESGDYRGALAVIKKAIALDKNEYRFYQFAAVIYKRMGNSKKYQEFGMLAAKAKLAAR